MSLILILIFSLIGCADNSTSAAELNPREIADALTGNLSFNDNLFETDPETALSNYGLEADSCEEIIVFRAGNSTSDELAVIKAAPSHEKEIDDAIRYRVDYLREGFADYGPEEVPKIDNAFIKNYGSVYILCICENSGNAEEIINSISK